MSEDTDIVIEIVESADPTRPDIFLELRRNPAQLDPLLDRLTTYLAEGAGKADLPVDREALRALAFDAIVRYSDDQDEARSPARESTTHKLPAAFSYIAHLLDDNYWDALLLFGATPESLERDPDDSPQREAIERYEVFQEELKTLWTRARKLPPPPPPPKRGRGKPRTPADLKEMVFHLARKWEELTGQPPTNDWEAGEPLSPATRFICDIIGFVTPERIGKVDKVLEKFITDRNKGHVP